MKKIYLLAISVLLAAAPKAHAQFNLGRLVQGGTKLVQAATVSSEQIQQYVKEYIADSDSKNKVAAANSKYTQRLNKLTEWLNSVTINPGKKNQMIIPLNFKVYMTDDVNAFACADGSVRVYSGLMDVMTDNELLGVIGHEMGHVAHEDTKKAFKQALVNAAIKDGLASTSNTVAALTDSQLGALGDALAQAKYSQKQENNADDYGYTFLKEHGKNPAAMAFAFRRLKELEAAAGNSNTSAINQLFSSHPELDKRIERMEKKALADGYSITKQEPATQQRTSKTSTSAKSKSKKTTTKKSTKSSKKSKK